MKLQRVSKSFFLSLGLFTIYNNINQPFYETIKYFTPMQKDLYKNYGGYALITGSSDGLGKQYAIELAKQGFNLILVSRNEVKLESDKINSDIDIQCVEFDFKNDNPESYKKIFSLDKDVSILVNNVGINHHHDYYKNRTPSQLQDIFCVNIQAIQMMSQHFLRKFDDRQQKSAIINIGSVAGQLNGPLNADYHASKCYDNFYSKQLQLKNENQNITIQTLIPGLMPTNMTQKYLKDFDILSINTQKVVQNSLQNIHKNGFVNGHPLFALQMSFNQMLGKTSDKMLLLTGLFMKHINE